MLPISNSLPPIRAIPQQDPFSSTQTNESTDSFRAILEQSVRTTSNHEAEAEAALNQFLSGEENDTHKLSMAVQRADLSFELFVQVRNKVIQAYQEVMRIPE